MNKVPSLARWPHAFLLLILIAPLAAGEGAKISEPVEVTVLAVADSSAGFIGSASTIEVRVLANGTGSVFVDTKPLSQMDMQGSARQAARVAAETLGLDWWTYDFLLKFRSETPVIGGPSAGGEMALAFAVALWNLEHPDSPWSLDKTVAGTGTINADGTIGPVGGIPAKAEGAKDHGIRVFLYPAGQDVATTRVASRFGVQTVAIDMKAHCASLDIECRPVSTLRQLLGEVAGVDLNAPDVRVPDTSDYEPYLGADVRGQVFAVTDANAAAYARLRTLALRASDENQVESVLAEANASVQAAQEFIDADKFYAAATSAFRARVSTRLASMLMDLYQAAKTTGVRDVVDACSSAARQAANEAGNLTAADIVAWYAVGEAQQRAKEAEDLARQAASSMRTAYRLDDWIQVLQEASLCMERAQSSHWWAGMPRVFPAGPAIPDPKAFAQDILSEAEEAILYGQAVGATGGQAKWQEAMRFVERQWWPAATRMGIQAMTESAVDLQSQAGDVPGSVLQAARQAAAQAVARARASGVEPLVSVSLMELAEEQDAKEELGSYWTARSLALMGPVRDRTVSTPPAPVAQPTEWPVWVAFAALVLSGLVAYRGVRRS